MKFVAIAVLCCSSVAFGQAVNPGGGGGGGTAGVTTFNGRSGAVTPTAADYTPALIGAAPALTNPVAGASAEYKFVDSTNGTSFPDSSGNGNSATPCSGANAPALTSYGLGFAPAGNIFGTECAITNRTTVKSFVTNWCPPTLGQTTGATTGGFPANQFPELAGSISSTGIIFTMSPLSVQYSLALQPSIYNIAGAAYTTQASGVYGGGCHTVAFVLDTLDHIYVDGVEVSYISQGSSASAAPISGGGTYYMGTGGSLSGNGTRGVMAHAFWYDSTVLTPAQVAAITAYSQAVTAGRPGWPKDAPGNSRTPQGNIFGDSIIATYTSTDGTQWTAFLTLNKAFQINNWGIGGMQVVDMPALSQGRWVTTTSPGNCFNIWDGGTNDSTVSSARTATDIASSHFALAAISIAHNCHPFIMTIISRGNGGDTMKDAANPLLRTGAAQAGATIIDFNATVLGADGANSNTACFRADVTHLTGMPATGTCGTLGSTQYSGYGLMAAVVSQAINSYYGSSAANPDISTATAFTATAANNNVIQTPTAAATYTLPDCQGLSTARVLTNGSASFNIVVSAINSQTILGSTTVAPLNTATLMPRIAGNTVSGCSWVRTQ